jgi:hypothetical protein
MSVSQACVSGAVRALNAGGRLLRSLGSDPPSLDGGSLHKAAIRRAGTSNFGDWSIEEPLERLLRSYRDEAALTTLGRITVRELIVSLLENLLRLEAERAADPSIERQRVEAPVFIIGLPRTGTTHLHGIVSADPANRAPSTWEVMFPSEYGRTPEGIAAARRRTGARLGWANRLAPEFMRIHPIAPDLPQECIAINAQVFLSIQFHTTHNVPSYQDWLETAAHDWGFGFHRRLLQHLQAQRAGDRWVLKAPGHLFALDALLCRYPDAKIIQTHRDPLRVMASMASHATVLRRAFSDAADPKQIAADWTDRWARALDRSLEIRDRVPSHHFLDIDFEAIEREPLAVVERVYDFLGWPLTLEGRKAMEGFLAANPKNKHGVHRYTLEQYGLSRRAEAARFRSYCERFQIAVQGER